MADNNSNEMVFEDISSSSKQNKIKKFSDETKAYGNRGIKNIDKIVKTIAVLVSIAVLLVFAALSILLIYMDKVFAAVAISVFIIGIILALICLFLIYAIGHIISQNKEILERL